MPTETILWDHNFANAAVHAQHSTPGTGAVATNANDALQFAPQSGGMAGGFLTDWYGDCAAIVSPSGTPLLSLTSARSNGYGSCVVYRPETCLDQRVFLVSASPYTSGAGSWGIGGYLRLSVGGMITGYYCAANAGGGLFGFTVTQGGASTSLGGGSAWTSLPAVGHYVAMDAKIVGTTLTISMYDLGTTLPSNAATAATIIAAATALTSISGTVGAIPSSGCAGLTVNITVNQAMTYARAIAFNESDTGGVRIYPNSPSIAYSPANWNVQLGYAQTINPGAYFSFQFTGTTATLSFDNSRAAAGNLGWYRVDGGAWTSFAISPTLAIAGLANTWHLFEFVFAGVTITNNRWNVNVAQQAAIFLGAVFDSGASVAAPSTAPYTVYVIGDSITEGYNSRGGGVQPAQNDALPSWAYSLRELLGCEVGVIGFGGQATAGAGSGNVPALTSTYNYLYQGVPRTFAPAPDLAIITSLQNDYSASIATSTVQAALVTVMTGLLAAGVKKILCMGPLSGGYKAVAQAAVAAMASPNVVFADAQGVISGAQFSDGLHPLAGPSRSIYGPWVAAQVKSQRLLGGSTAAAVASRSGQRRRGR